MPLLKNLFLIGPTGVGKTTIGKALAHALQADFFDSDQSIIQHRGKSITEIFAKEGEAKFREYEMQVIKDLTALSNVVLAIGAGAILASSNRQLLAERGKVIYLRISLANQLRRLAEDKSRPLLQTKNLAVTLSNMHEARAPLYEQIAAWTVDVDNLSVQEIVERIIKNSSPLAGEGGA